MVPALLFASKGKFDRICERGGRMGEPIKKEGGCVAIFLGHEQSVLYIGIIS